MLEDELVSVVVDDHELAGDAVEPEAKRRVFDHHRLMLRQHQASPAGGTVPSRTDAATTMRTAKDDSRGTAVY